MTLDHGGEVGNRAIVVPLAKIGGATIDVVIAIWPEPDALAEVGDRAVVVFCLGKSRAAASIGQTKQGGECLKAAKPIRDF